MTFILIVKMQQNNTYNNPGIAETQDLDDEMQE